MNFALLGCDPDTLELAKAVARSDEHRLVWAHDLGQFAPAIRAASPGVLIAEHWEGLLAGATADVVIVSRSADQEGRTEQLRKLAQAGTTMIVSHPVLDSMLVYYELDMIRQESRAVMLPYVPESSHPAWRRLAELAGDPATGPLGVLEQIVIEHSFVTRGRSDVLHGFVRDMELVRPLAGAIDKVSAMTSAGVRSSPEAINYGTLSVQMSGTSNVLVRWSVLAADAESSRFTLLGTRGRAVLDAVKTGPWQLEVRDGQTVTESFASGDAAAGLRQLVERLPNADAGLPDWIDACRTMELADAVEHSLQRGRTIELFFETPSEQATFKGVMSGIGCLLLIAGLLVLVVATTAVHAGVPLADYWPFLLLGVLVIFLVLQALRLVFPAESPPTDNTKRSP
ncbi:MAG TPA: hypothetical protein VNH11_20605 [Pirellulales bacterium]|nr:hypothetical protein [Pirellulales bacterium]